MPTFVSERFDPAIRVASAEAYELLLADAAERSADPEHWTKDDADRLTSAVLRELGEGATEKRFALTRAARFFEAYAAAEGAAEASLRGKFAKRFQPLNLHEGRWALLLAVVAYLAGAFLDRWTAEGKIINLLSPPILGLILWNLAVYLWLLLSLMLPARPIDSTGAGIRRLLARVMTKGAQLKLRQAQRDFALKTLQLAGAETAAAVSFALHLSAAAFAVGMMASIAVRGIGTAYVVGWESTWLAESPATIAFMLEALLGWIPASLVGSVDFSVTGIEAMNLTAGGAAAQVAPWILRLIGLLTAAVVIPRLFLSLLAAWSIRRARRSIRFPLSLISVPVPHLEQPAPKAARPLSKARDGSRNEAAETDAFVVLMDASIRLPEGGTADPSAALGSRLAGRSSADVGRLLIEPVNVWDEDAPSKILAAPQREAFALWIDAAGTPEDDVHGAVLLAMADRSLRAPVVFLDAEALSARFGGASDNVKSRIQLWTRFAQARRAELIVIGQPPSSS